MLPGEEGTSGTTALGELLLVPHQAMGSGRVGQGLSLCSGPQVPLPTPLTMNRSYKAQASLTSLLGASWGVGEGICTGVRGAAQGAGVS